MKLTEIRIDNFRSIKECHLYLSEVTAVIGENNAGKTALLRALNSVFNWEYEQAYFLNNAHQYAVFGIDDLEHQPTLWLFQCFYERLVTLLDFLLLSRELWWGVETIV